MNLENIKWNSITEGAMIIGEALYLETLIAKGSEVAKHKYDNLMNGICSKIAQCEDEQLCNRITDIFAYTQNIGNLQMHGLNLLKDLVNILNATPEDKLKFLVKMNMYCKYYFNNNFELMDSGVTGTLIAIALSNGEKLDKNKTRCSTLTMSMRHIMEGLTPAQIYQVFPIKKEYDGEKYGWKDYYYCMELVNEIGLNTPMKNTQPDQFIMECSTHSFFLREGLRIMNMCSEFTGKSILDIFSELNEEIENENKLHIVK